MNKRLMMASLCALLATGCAKQESASPIREPATNAAVSESASPPKVAIPPGTYTLDKAHSSLIFRVSHLGFSNYTARFKQFDAQLQFDPENYAASSLTVSIDPRSLDVENPPAGFLEELIGKDWIDAAQFPTLEFKSTKVTPTGPRTMRIDGDLTLHGATKPIALEATFNGGYAGHPMDPHARAGFSAQGAFKRSDFGIAYGIPEPGTTMGVSDKVDVTIETEFSGPAWTKKDGEGA